MNIPDFDDEAATWDDDPRKVQRAADIARRILSLCPCSSGDRVLDFGAGTGLLGTHFVEAGAEVTFVDPSAGMRAQLEAKLRARSAEGWRSLDLEDPQIAVPGGYDLIVSLMALHHVPDPGATIAQLSQWLAPGGSLALCDLEPEDGSFHDPGTTGVHHGFSPEQLRKWCEAAGLSGFRCETVHAVEHDQDDGGVRRYPLFLVVAKG